MVYSRNEGLAAVYVPCSTVSGVRHDATWPRDTCRPNECPGPRRSRRVMRWGGVAVETLGCPFKRTPSATRAAP